MVATPMAANVSKWKQPGSKRENLDQITMTDHRVGIINVDPGMPHPPRVDVGLDDPPTLTCIHCPKPLAPGHRAYCLEHKAEIDDMPWPPPAVVGGSE